MSIVTIQNETMKVQISTAGAEIKSIKKGDTEFIWCGDSSVWEGTAPILFPICGGLKEDKYIYQGKEYVLYKHGFIKNTEFQVESCCEQKAVLITKSNEETKKSYPFDFEFRAEFSLLENTLTVAYRIKNNSEEDMYFSVGAHEAYACPEGIEEYTVFFEQPETLDASVLNGNLVEDKTVRIAENTDALPLKEEYFAVDALVFKRLKSRKVRLEHQNSSKKITLSFPGHDYFLIWQKPGAKYICLEPWCGIPDGVNSGYDFTRKEGIIRLKDETVYTHQITFEE